MWVQFPPPHGVGLLLRSVFGRSQIKVSTIGTKQFEAVSEGELGADYHFKFGDVVHGVPSVNVVTREFAGCRH